LKQLPLELGTFKTQAFLDHFKSKLDVLGLGPTHEGSVVEREGNNETSAVGSKQVAHAAARHTDPLPLVQLLSYDIRYRLSILCQIFSARNDTDGKRGKSTGCQMRALSE
jgi:hypothetical protein